MWAQCGVTSPEPKLSSGARALNCAGAAHVEPGEFRWPRQAARMSGQNPLVAPPHRCLRSDPYLPDPRFTSPTVSALGYRGERWDEELLPAAVGMGREIAPGCVFPRGSGSRPFTPGLSSRPELTIASARDLPPPSDRRRLSPKLLCLNLLRELRALLRTELFLLAVFRQKLEYGKPKAG